MYNLPLFYLLLKPIYLLTHNVFLLRLPSVIFSLVGVGVLQKIAAKIYGKYYSLLIPLLVFFTLMFTEVAANIRPYGLLFMLSALMIYMYDIRNHNADWRNIVVLGLLMILFAYTHWYASLLIAAYALSDLYLWCRKKVPFRCVLSYIICALGFVPWLVYLYSVHKTTSDYWGHIRSYFYAFSVIKQIGGLPVIVLFMQSLLLLCFNYSSTGFMVKNTLWCIFFVFTASWVYSYSCPQGSIYVERYFFVILPHILLVCVYSVYVLLQKKFYIRELRNMIEKKSWQASIVAVYVILFYVSLSEINRIPSNFAEENRNFPQVLQQAGMSKRRTLILTYFPLFWEFFFPYNGRADIAYIKEFESYSDVLGTKHKKSRSEKLMFYNCLNNKKSCKQAIEECFTEQLSITYQNKNNRPTVPLQEICSYDEIYFTLVDDIYGIVPLLENFFRQHKSGDKKNDFVLFSHDDEL
jgi:hypothetical protein